MRDDNFDTAPYAGRFVNGEPQFLDEPPQFNQQRFGGYLGGPISKDSVFFFGRLRELRERRHDGARASPTTGAIADWRP